MYRVSPTSNLVGVTKKTPPAGFRWGVFFGEKFSGGGVYGAGFTFQRNIVRTSDLMCPNYPKE